LLRRIIIKFNVFSKKFAKKKVDFYHCNTINSTNKFALENISKFNKNTIIITDIQTSGRGRLSRTWKSDTKGNIYASIVLKNIPKYSEDSPIATITQYTSTIIRDVISDCIANDSVKIKWPNDILINDKKVCGILSNAVFSKNNLEAVVIGFGINLVNTKENLKTIDKPATSIFIETSKILDVNDILNEVLDHFFEKLDLFFTEGFNLIKNDYEKYSYTIGKNVTVDMPQKQISGFAKSVDERGLLIVIDKDNKINKINTGDVLWKEQLGHMD